MSTYGDLARLVGIAMFSTLLIAWIVRWRRAKAIENIVWGPPVHDLARWRFNPPPGWPPSPPGFMPHDGWQPDPSWPKAPAGWQYWVPREPPYD